VEANFTVAIFVSGEMHSNYLDC